MALDPIPDNLTEPEIRANVTWTRAPAGFRERLWVHRTPVAFQIDSDMHEFQVLATFFVIAAVYVGLFLAAERFFMKDK